MKAQRGVDGIRQRERQDEDRRVRPDTWGASRGRSRGGGQEGDDVEELLVCSRSGVGEAKTRARAVGFWGVWEGGSVGLLDANHAQAKQGDEVPASCVYLASRVRYPAKVGGAGAAARYGLRAIKYRSRQRHTERFPGQVSGWLSAAVRGDEVRAPLSSSPITMEPAAKGYVHMYCPAELFIKTNRGPPASASNKRQSSMSSRARVTPAQ